MVARSPFDKEPGTGLSGQLENIGRSSLDVVQPQLFFIRDHFFSSEADGWPMTSFPGFLTFPVIAGYVLGGVGAYLQFQKIQPSEAEILKCVIDVHNHFFANNLDVEISTHYMMQQDVFKFGLDIGVADTIRYLTEQARAGKSQYALLAAILKIFLQYDDAITLKLNLGTFCKLHDIPKRDNLTFEEIIERWEVQKQYDMQSLT